MENPWKSTISDHVLRVSMSFNGFSTFFSILGPKPVPCPAPRRTRRFAGRGWTWSQWRLGYCDVQNVTIYIYVCMYVCILCILCILCVYKKYINLYIYIYYVYKYIYIYIYIYIPPFKGGWGVKTEIFKKGCVTPPIHLEICQLNIFGLYAVE